MSILDFKSVIDSRDIIERIEELCEFREACTDTGEAFPIEDQEELNFLLAIQNEANCSPDWVYGSCVIAAEYFTSYIKEFIDDCYDPNSSCSTGHWPFNHMQMDYEAAAEEAKQDYIEFNVDGYGFLIRA